ncbi:hypothetical protein ACFX1T_006625 [Malus domestica]
MKEVMTTHILETFYMTRVQLFIHCQSGRETNKVAHRLARMSLSYGNTVTWFEEPPDVILDLLFEDSNS